MYTVVVADDEEELRSALVRRVDWESIGFQVVGEAENGVEALELVERYEPDLLLTDIRMPFLSGIELARSVREVRPSTQIAFLSGFDDFSYAQQAIQYNIVSYMLKPISATELTEELIKIRQKIDEKFKRFAAADVVADRGEMISFLMPLLLDEDSETKEDKEEALLQEAVACGLLKSQRSNFAYAIMVSSILGKKEGNNQTSRATVQAVNLILEKYVNHTSFYINGRVVSFLQAAPSRLDKYLHIIVEELVQNVERIMDCEAQIGVSRITERLSSAHEAYSEAMKTIRYSMKNGIRANFYADMERTLVLEEKKKTNASLSDKAKEIIERNYMNQDLSLGFVSNEIAVSPNYLSAIIKKETGSTFIDLLSQKRIEVAKELLLDNDMKIREIAEKCGYSDQHYFSYCFKKYTGISPNACRRK